MWYFRTHLFITKTNFDFASLNNYPHAPLASRAQAANTYPYACHADSVHFVYGISNGMTTADLEEQLCITALENISREYINH